MTLALGKKGSFSFTAIAFFFFFFKTADSVTSRDRRPILLPANHIEPRSLINHVMKFALSPVAVTLLLHLSERTTK